MRENGDDWCQLQKKKKSQQRQAIPTTTTREEKKIKTIFFFHFVEATRKEGKKKQRTNFFPFCSVRFVAVSCIWVRNVFFFFFLLLFLPNIHKLIGGESKGKRQRQEEKKKVQNFIQTIFLLFFCKFFSFSFFFCINDVSQAENLLFEYLNNFSPVNNPVKEWERVDDDDDDVKCYLRVIKRRKNPYTRSSISSNWCSSGGGGGGREIYGAKFNESEEKSSLAMKYD